MGLSAGTRLGPYKVLSPLGKGGMGEVWKARDTRLGRDVAVKVLPADVAADPLALARFESEARAVAALSHPSILALFDVGEAHGVHFVVTELLEGETLRVALAGGPLPVSRALEIAEEVSGGLAAAHENGLVHRDVKPENLFLTRGGHVRILDFGLAQATAPAPGACDPESPTSPGSPRPDAGAGTVSYMSPELVRNEEITFRSDQFSFGVVLYEMLAGKRPFRGHSSLETLASIIRDDPPPLSTIAPGVPPPVRWIVEQCLDKAPEKRFDSTHDLANQISTVRRHLAEAAADRRDSDEDLRARRPRRRRTAAAVAAGLLLVAGLGAAFLVGRKTAPPVQPRIQRLTFRRGTVHAARFSPDGHSVLYSAAWEGKPIEVFSVRLDTSGSRPLGLGGNGILAVSESADLLLALGSRQALANPFFVRVGTLARMKFSGGTPRPLEENVTFADLTRDGTEIALARQVQDEIQLEFPAGTVVCRPSPGWVSSPRISPAGDLVAFLEHPVAASGDHTGWVAVVDRAGKKKKLTGTFMTSEGLAWSPRGNEIWFTSVRTGARMEIRAVALDGRERLVFAQTAPLVLQDVAPDGRVLVTTFDFRGRTLFRDMREPDPRELSWMDLSWPTDLSEDGRQIALQEGGEGSRHNEIAVRETSGSPAMILGPGRWGRFSQDGRFVVTPHTDVDTIAIYPIGTGSSRTVRLPGFYIDKAGLQPDGKTLWFGGRKLPEGWRYWLTDLSGSDPRPVTPVLKRLLHPYASRDGRHFFGEADGGAGRYPLESGRPLAIPGLSREDYIVGHSADGRTLAVQRRLEFPARLRRVDVNTGRSEPFFELHPLDPSEVIGLRVEAITPDLGSFVYGSAHFLSELHVIEGLK